MKLRTNISGILLAVLVFVAGNGIAISEHICNTSKTHDYSFFKEADCGMEKPQNSCCAKKMENKKNCCKHKQFYKKLSIEGFASKQIEIKPFDKLVLNDYWVNSYAFNYQIYDRYIIGIPPPDNLYIIKYLLRPTPVELQIFRC